MAAACYETLSADWLEQKNLSIFDELPSPPTPGASPVHDCTMTFAQQNVEFVLPGPLPVAVAMPSVNPKVEFLGPTLSLPLTIPHVDAHNVMTVVPHQMVTQIIPHVVHTPQTQATIIPQGDTASLLQEFETVYDEVMMGGALTPPQSPPGATTLHELKVVSVSPSKVEAILPDCPNTPITTPNSPRSPMTDLSELDEIVRTRAEETMASPRSDCSSSPSFSEISEAVSPSPVPSPSAESSDDPDWVPSPAAPSVTPSRGRGRKRATSTKPYARATQEDKKLRKKEQNKNAATRYRLKKKQEVEEILGEEQELQDENDHLTQKVTELSQEIRYIKDLMRELFRKKGLIK